jgi:hypothetical protein
MVSKYLRQISTQIYADLSVREKKSVYIKIIRFSCTRLQTYILDVKTVGSSATHIIT